MTQHVRATTNLHWAGPGWSVEKDVADLEALVKAGATRIGAQECRRQVIVGFLAANPSWSWAGDAATLERPAYRVVPIFYDATVYSCEPSFIAVPIGELGPKGAGEDRIDHKVIACPIFTDRETGVRFRDFNLHQIVSKDKRGLSDEERRNRQRAWNKVNAAVRAIVLGDTTHGLPVIGGGDWNATRDQVGSLS